MGSPIPSGELCACGVILLVLGGRCGEVSEGCDDDEDGVGSCDGVEPSVWSSGSGLCGVLFAPRRPETGTQREMP